MHVDDLRKYLSTRKREITFQEFSVKRLGGKFRKQFAVPFAVGNA